MLKFMENKEAFEREIAKREPLKGGKDSDNICRVVSILEHHVLACGALAKYKQVRLTDTVSGLVEAPPELQYLIVMPLGVEVRVQYAITCFVTCAVQDLRDETIHSTFAGLDQNRALGIAISVAKSLQFLNEECKVMHGTLSVTFQSPT